MRFPEFGEYWKVKRLGSILTIGSGKDYKHLKPGNIPVYGTGGYMSSVDDFLYDGVSIGIGRKGTIDKPILLNGKFWTVDTLFYTHSFNGVRPRFLFSVFQNIKWKKYNEASGVPSLSKSTIEKININIPSLVEQEKISSLLTLVDDRIETQNKIIQHLESLIKGFSQKLFSQKIRFKDERGNEFSAWEYKNGNLLFSNISDKEHNSDLEILAITQDKGAIPRDLIDYNIGVTAKSVSSYKVVQVGDFIISLRSFQGGIEYSNYKGICSPAYIILRPIENMSSLFYKYYMKTASYIIQLNKKLEGIRDGKMISYKYFSEIKLPYPSLEEQTKIANFLTSLDAKLEKEKQILEHYQKQKKYLLQNLFI